MGNFYNISTKYENAIYERGEENYFVAKIKDIDNSTNVNPSSVSISIYGPCSSECTIDASMISLSDGVYFYSYTIPNDAVFGQYEIIMTASSPTYSSIYKDKFFVLPWNTIYDVRRYSGITSKKSINDHDIANIIWEAYHEALKEVYLYWDEDYLECNPCFDGTTTIFNTKHAPIADSNGDGAVTGYGETSCGTDIDGWWMDAEGDCHRLKITVNEAHCGNITVTQLNGDAIPASAKWVKVNYYTEWRTYDKEIFKSAVAFLAAHKCIVRFKELGKATLADLHSNKEVILHDRDRMKFAYKQAMKKIKKPVIGASMLHGENNE